MLFTVFFYICHSGLALEKEKDRDAAKRHTMSHPPDHIPELDSPRQSRSPLKKGKKEQVRKVHRFPVKVFFSHHLEARKMFFINKHILHIESHNTTNFDHIIQYFILRQICFLCCDDLKIKCYPLFKTITQYTQTHEFF